MKKVINSLDCGGGSGRELVAGRWVVANTDGQSLLSKMAAQDLEDVITLCKYIRKINTFESNFLLLLYKSLWKCD